MDEPDAIGAWDALTHWASEPNPFFESWYLLPALRGLDPAGRVQMLRFEIDGNLAGLLPLVHARRYYTRPIPHLASWLHPNCFLGAPLVARGLERPFWLALLAWADGQGGLGLFLHLSGLPLSGALYEALRAVLAEDGRNAALVARQNHVMLTSDLAPDAYFEAAVSAKKRKEYRRQANRLADHGKVAFTRHKDAADLARWTEDFLHLEAAGWKGAAGSALASHAATEALFRDSLTGAAERGRLERLALTLDGRPVAMLATFLTPPGAFMFKTAFDETLSPFSPGVLLQRENLAMLEAPDIGWVDSCAGDDHPMITHLWRERRPVGRVSLAIGGAARRGVFGVMARRELGGDGFGI
jgi:CelD/BcsL family acetyltransferase involved in cellulose biosynthesis